MPAAPVASSLMLLRRAARAVRVELCGLTAGERGGRCCFVGCCLSLAGMSGGGGRGVVGWGGGGRQVTGRIGGIGVFEFDSIGREHGVRIALRSGGFEILL